MRHCADSSCSDSESSWTLQWSSSGLAERLQKALEARA